MAALPGIDAPGALPFERPALERATHRDAAALIDALGLSGRVEIQLHDAARALRLERFYRARFWSGRQDPLRERLHAVKWRAHRVAATMTELTEAWLSMRAVVEGARWSSHLGELTSNCSPERVRYLRLFFRFAQQTWTRAARWSAVRPDAGPCPFAPWMELLRSGVWPVCFEDGKLICMRLDEDRETHVGESTMMRPRPVRSRRLFLCAPFAERSLAGRWRRALERRGWDVVFGPVDESLGPPEPRLGERIRASAAMAALVPDIEEPFGLPWWNHQELEYAGLVECPTAIVTAAPRALLAGVSQGARVLSPGGPDVESAVASWLQKIIGGVPTARGIASPLRDRLQSKPCQPT